MCFLALAYTLTSQHLQSKVSRLCPEDRQCVLSFDEMALKADLTRYFEKVVRIKDNGQVRIMTPTTSALAFMVRGIRQKWKQALAYTLTSQHLQSKSVYESLIYVIRILSEIGLKVCAVVSDQGSTFSKMFRELG